MLGHRPKCKELTSPSSQSLIELFVGRVCCCLVVTVVVVVVVGSAELVVGGVETIN